MFVLVGFAFLAGVVTILSPCILPVLPIVLSSSIGGGKRRPFGVMVGFILSFTFFSLALTAIVRATGISADFLRNVAVVLIFLFGVSMLFSGLQVFLEKLFSRLANSASGSGGSSDSGFRGGVFVGLSLGLIWTPCVGPILASVITLAATSSVTFEAVFITLAYSLGTAIPMVLLIYGGRALLQKVPFLLKNSAKIQKVFAVIVILMSVAIYFNLDRKFQAYVIEKFPSYGSGLTKIEESDIVKQNLKKLGMGDKTEVAAVDSSVECKDTEGKAPGFDGGNNWLNSPKLKLEALKGKVVLVDFWTYTCINCIRTLPFVTSWYDKYKDLGLVVIGVHTPEFEFEKKAENVSKAMQDFGIKYPVVQDNDYKIWQNFSNSYWPAEYLIDKNGCMRHERFGEGGYEESEKMIQTLLKETGADVKSDVVKISEYQPSKQTPETYLGAKRMERFASLEQIELDKDKLYSEPKNLPANAFAYGGMWNVALENAKPKDGAILEMNISAKEVYLVMRSSGGKAGRLRVYLDGNPISEGVSGQDVKDGTVEVKDDRLYRLVKLPKYENHILRLEALDNNLEFFAFTFG